MKKNGLMISVLLISTFIYSNVIASSFTVIDSFFNISGSMDLVPPPSSFHGAFSENSSAPLDGNINFEGKYIHSQASYEGVEVSGDIRLSWLGSAAALASTEVLFRPNFIGQGDPITFTFYRVGFVSFFPVASIEDFTTGETIFSNSINEGNEVLSYPKWDLDHVYRLYMKASLGFATNDDGRLYVKNNMSFASASVPEPATVLLLGCGLIGLAGLRRKFKK